MAKKTETVRLTVDTEKYNRNSYMVGDCGGAALV